jgi:hypothetical protein
LAVAESVKLTPLAAAMCAGVSWANAAFAARLTIPTRPTTTSFEKRIAILHPDGMRMS